MAFNDYIANFSPCAPQLPLIHTAHARGFGKILSEQSIRPIGDCPVFGEKLVYVFYGRPAYKVRVEKDQRVTDQYLPIAMLFEPEALVTICRVFPFDTGAFSAERYQQALHRDVDIDEFKATPTLESAQKIVAAFFSTNSNYVLGDTDAARRPNFFDEPEAHAYLSIIDGAVATEADDRRFTIELQTKEEIRLDSKLKAVVVPHTMLASSKFQDFLRTNPHVSYLTYSRFKGVDLGGLHTTILQRVHDYLMSSKYFVRP